MASRDWSILGAAQQRRYASFFGTEAKARSAYQSGTSLAGARGHGPAEQRAESTLSRYYRVAQRLLRGEPLSKAARAENLAPESFRQINREARVVGKAYREPRTPGRKRSVFDRYVSGFEPGQPGHVTAGFFDRSGEFHGGVALDQRFAGIVGRYLNAVDTALQTGDTAALRAFARRVVFDTSGNRYTLLTDLGALRRGHESLSDAEREDYFRLLYPRKRGRRHAA